jgi:YVTN family beta-propeller protein
MKFSRVAALPGAAVVCVLISGCGDIFRPVATPLPQPSPDPQNFRLAVFASCQLDPNAADPKNPCLTPSPANPAPTSQVTDLNVSGDSVEGVVPVGNSPVFALVQKDVLGNIVTTTADFGNDTVTQHTDSHAAGAPAVLTAPSTIGLPSGAKPTSIVDANGTFYVAESGRNAVGVLQGFNLSLATEIPVGTTPVNMSVLPNAKEVYVLNRDSNDVTVISTADNSVLDTVPVGSTPVWAVPSADSSRVFVVNQGSGNVSVIDATNHTVIATLAVATSPNYAVFDAKNQRVLVTNSGSNSLSVINGDPTSPNPLTVIKTITVGTTPRSVTALADGTRIYVANTASNSVSVISSLNLTVTKTIPVGTSPVSIASDGDSAKVFTANRDSQNVSVILTSSDSEATDASGNTNRIPAPQADPNCVPSSTTTCPRLSPIFVAVGG